MRTPFSLAVCVLIAFAVFGCDRVDVEKVREAIVGHKQTVLTLAEAAQELQAVAELTGSTEMIAAAAAAKKALDIAAAEIPKMEAQLKKLEDQAPWWKVAVALAVPYIGPLLGRIPGPIGAVGTLLAELYFRLSATKADRERDKLAHAELDKTNPKK